MILLAIPRIRADEVVKSAADLHGMDLRLAAEARPVRLEGVITFVDAASGRAYLQDSSGGVSIGLSPGLRLPDNIRPGTLVEIEGVTSAGRFLPMVEGAGGSQVIMRAKGQKGLPDAKAVNGPQLTLPDMDSQWIEIWGVIRPPPPAYRGAVLALEAEGRTFFGYLPETAATRELPPSLLGIRVRIRAVAGTFVNERRQMTRRVLFLPSIESITTEWELTLDDPFQRPVTAFDDLLRAHSQGASERNKVRGVVTMVLPDQGLYLREDNDGGLWVQTSQRIAPDSVTPGDVLEAVGWPEAADFRPDLRGAVFRVVARGQERPAPFETDARTLLSARHHAAWVTLEGTLIGMVEEPNGVRLVLSDEDRVFDGRIPRAVLGNAAPQWSRDSRLRVTGICENVPGEGISSPQTSPTFFIRIDSMDGIRVLSSPPWWTTRRILWALGITVGGALLAAGWAVALRRRVSIQTRVIEAQVHREGAQEERQRLARELHDSLEQEMTGVGLQLETALARLDQDSDAARNSIERARRLLIRAQRETRETIWDLRSSPTDPGVLPGLLKELLSPLTDSAGITLDLSVSNTVPDGLPGSLIHQLVRIAQEGVANAVRHAQATTVEVSVDCRDGFVVLAINDDGCGFDQSTAPGARQGHFGLTGMHERASKCGGEIKLFSKPGGGTRLLFTAPAHIHS